MLTPELQLSMRTGKELMATGRENDGSDMPRGETALIYSPALAAQARHAYCMRRHPKALAINYFTGEREG